MYQRYRGKTKVELTFNLWGMITQYRIAILLQCSHIIQLWIHTIALYNLSCDYVNQKTYVDEDNFYMSIFFYIFASISMYCIWPQSYKMIYCRAVFSFSILLHECVFFRWCVYSAYIGIKYILFFSIIAIAKQMRCK